MPASLSDAEESPTDEATLLKRITVDPRILGGKPIIRGRRLGLMNRESMPRRPHGLHFLSAQASLGCERSIETSENEKSLE
jgi:hypothetical protein